MFREKKIETFRAQIEQSPHSYNLTYKMPVTTRLMKKKQQIDSMDHLQFLINLQNKETCPSGQNISLIRIMTTILLCPIITDLMVTNTGFRNMVLLKCEEFIEKKCCYPELRLLCNELIRRYE